MLYQRFFCAFLSSTATVCQKLYRYHMKCSNVKFDGQRSGPSCRRLKAVLDWCCSAATAKPAAVPLYLREATASMTALKSASLYPAARACRAGAVQERTGQLCCHSNPVDTTVPPAAAPSIGKLAAAPTKVGFW